MHIKPEKLQSRQSKLIFVSVLLIALGIILIKAIPQIDIPSSSERDLRKALNNNSLTMVFFHSTTCDPCMEMIKNVGLVYPEFQDSITLIDVNVSDTSNHDLLRAQEVKLIPSLKLFDQNGQSRIIYGVLSTDQIREELSLLE